MDKVKRNKITSVRHIPPSEPHIAHKLQQHLQSETKVTFIYSVNINSSESYEPLKHGRRTNISLLLLLCKDFFSLNYDDTSYIKTCQTNSFRVQLWAWMSQMRHFWPKKTEKRVFTWWSKGKMTSLLGKSWTRKPQVLVHIFITNTHI